MAQVDCFLKIAGVDGESVDAKHQGEIEVESFSWGETGAPVTWSGSGPAAGKTQAQDLQFVKKIDKSSPLLMLGCATGQQFKHAVLTIRKAGGSQQEYLKITLDTVLISSYQVASRRTEQCLADGSGEPALRKARDELQGAEGRRESRLGGEGEVRLRGEQEVVEVVGASRLRITVVLEIDRGSPQVAESWVGSSSESVGAESISIRRTPWPN